MKNYREIADSVFARRDEYVIRQRKKKQAVTRVTASVGSVALVSLAGIALFKNDAFHETPPVATSTTTTHSPVTEGVPTTITSIPSASASSEATDPTTAITTASSKTETTVGTTPTTTAKTQPTETTATTTAPRKTVIAATKSDNTGSYDEMLLSNKRIYITPLLQQIMEAYEGCDVEFAVIVSIPVMQEDYYVDFWGSEEQYIDPYVESVLNQRFEALKAVCTEDPIDIFCGWAGYGLDMEYHAYYVELSAESINALAEKGGYTFRWASLNQTDYGYWDVDE